MSDINVSVTTQPIQITAAHDNVIDIVASAVGIQGPQGLPGTGGTSVSGDFYLSSNPSGFVSSGTTDNLYINRTSNQNVTGIKTFIDRIAAPYISGSTTNFLIDTTNGTIYNTSKQLIIDVNGKILYSGIVGIIDWGNKILIDNASIHSVKWQDRSLLRSTSLQSFDWESGKLYDQAGATSIDIQNKILSGNWINSNLNVIGNIKTTGIQSTDGVIRIDLSNGTIFDMDNGTNVVDLLNKLLYNNSNQIRIDWQNERLSGDWNTLGSFKINDQLLATSGNLQTSGQTLNSKINSLSGYTSGFVFQSTGFSVSQTLNQPTAYSSLNINALRISPSDLDNAGTIIFDADGGGGWDIYCGDTRLIAIYGGSPGAVGIDFPGLTTNGILDQHINSLSANKLFGSFTGIDSNGPIKISGNFVSTGNIQSTGQTLNNKINVLSGYLNASVTLKRSDSTILNYSGNTDTLRGTQLIAAQTLANSGDTIYVYESVFLPSSIGKNGVNWWFAPGINISGTDIPLISDSAGISSFVIGGNANFYSKNNSVIYFNGSGIVFFEGNILSNDGTFATVWAANGKQLYFKTTEIRSSNYDGILVEDHAEVNFNIDKIFAGDNSVELAVNGIACGYAKYVESVNGLNLDSNTISRMFLNKVVTTDNNITDSFGFQNSAGGGFVYINENVLLGVTGYYLDNLLDVANSRNNTYISKINALNNTTGNLYLKSNPSGFLVGQSGTQPNSGLLTLPLSIDVFGDSTKLLGGPSGWLNLQVSGKTLKIPYYL